MRRADDKTISVLPPAEGATFFALTPPERENVLVRARLELFKLTLEVNGDEHARLEMDLYAWIGADNARAEMFWQEPEKAIRHALSSQLVEAMGKVGLDIARLSGN